ncbi:hypothetical protein PLEOSDRAFT_1095375 [Pleurotus ostreatus PC15]|uniref:Uncharacterized protein n=1 Tax=Pleurotus ostreatus (strain PC15) TaxID=1137138 RepID=A0A067NZD6_PLEO1|nr:hypothetical protein PLEOSDRAFT_1095375 [Pleurotus ostreatus PC15]
MNAAQQAVEEKKLSAYTELSASVSKISSSASSMMAPALAEVFLHHTECKQRADQSSAALGAAWTKIMNEFLSEINRNVEEGLRNIVERLEGQDITRMRKQGSPGLKRAWDGHEATDVGRHPSLEGGWQGKISGRNRATSDSDYGGIAPAKRRRTGGSSHTPEANDQLKDDLNPYTTSFVESLRQQMNMQDRQLQALQRENKESPPVQSIQLLEVADTQTPRKSTPPITKSNPEGSLMRRSKRISKAADAVDELALATEEIGSSGDEGDADGAERGSGEDGLDAIDSMQIPEDGLSELMIILHHHPTPDRFLSEEEGAGVRKKRTSLQLGR